MRLLALALACLMTLACTAPGAETGGPTGSVPADSSYTVAGVVKALPTGSGTRQISIRHQPIPDFVDRDGEIVGMHSMTMPFPLADGIELESIEVGSPVRFTFEVRWQGGPSLLVTTLEALPPETEIDWSGGEVAVDGLSLAGPAAEQGEE